MNVINEWIPRWHFLMLNDTKRNEAFRQAILHAVREEGVERVLDIGTGTGILALYAHEAGAKKIYACESNEIMSQIACNVFENDKLGNIVLLKDHSTNLSVKDLGDAQVDLIVTEIFDSGVFGEGVLSTLIHAKKILLKESGRVIPNKVELFVVGVDHVGIAEKQESINSTLENSIYLKNTTLIPKVDGPYDTYSSAGGGDHLIIRTERAHAFTVNFNDLQSMQEADEGQLDATVQLRCSEGGHIEGFIVFFALHLDDKNVIANFDETPMTSEITKCWDPVLFRLNEPMEVRKYQVLKATVSCRGGVLNLKHEYDPIDERVVAVDPELYAFLADDEYLYELEYNVIKLLKKNKKKFVNFADFLTFPHIGINLLKEGEIETLYCPEKTRDFVEKISDWNCITKGAIKFVQDLEDFLENDIKLDIILMQPITGHGTLNEEHLKHYETLKTNCLSTSGAIFPNKIDLCAKLIHSSWLQQVTSVQNENLQDCSIPTQMNEYSTRHQFEFKDFDSSDLSDITTIAKIHFDENFHQKDVIINLNMVRNQINGILYYFKIFFTSNSIPVLTNRKKSFCTQNCFVQNFDVAKDRTSVVVRCIQDEFVFRCEILENTS